MSTRQGVEAAEDRRSVVLAEGRSLAADGVQGGEGGAMTHIDEDMLERYALRWADEAQTVAVEEHLLVCDQCRDALIEAERYIGKLKPLLENTAVTVAEHSTPEGPVPVRVRRASKRFWYARVVGAQLDSGIVCASPEAAMRDAVRQFAEAFPEHRCAAECKGGTEVEGQH
jgi:hypothetical protein